MRLWRLGSVGQMITGTLESLQLTQGFKHEPSVPVINTKAYRECTHLNIQAAPYATQTHDIMSVTIVGSRGTGRKYCSVFTCTQSGRLIGLPR